MPTNEKKAKSDKPGILETKYRYPPFSVLNARDGKWQKRKRYWIDYGIKSEKGRECGTYDHICKWFDKKGKKRTGLIEKSVFDPFLTELSYFWFCPPGGQIIDPFAGGSVRGIVAALMGYTYWGCDIRLDQIYENYLQADHVCPGNIPVWVCGDALEKMPYAPEADMIYSCPPYGDLEKYSDNERDLSNMEYHTFIAAYKRIILRSYKRLKYNRFACFVVGDFRDKKGCLRNFVSDTISAFLSTGMKLYNEAILITQAGTLPIRVSGQFKDNRKLGKCHQNVLVFVKGDWRRAVEEINTATEKA